MDYHTIMAFLWCVPPGLLLIRISDNMGDGNVGSDDSPRGIAVEVK